MIFKNEVLNEILNRYRENKLAHAYLIETNNIENALEDIKTLIKNLNCPHEYKNECTTCNLCNLINKDNLPSLKIIKPDGTSIKKNQIEELKNNFKSIPIYSKYNTYIILDAEKLNASSANSMLKFIEEPETGILGFFITTNKDIMIETIKSRCESFILNYENEIDYNSEKYQNIINNIKNYLSKIKSKEIINNKIEVIDKYPERTDIINYFKIMFDIIYNNYLKSINEKYNENLIINFDLGESTKNLQEILNILTDILQNLSYNVSIELLLDKFVIEMRNTYGE